jgi:hypothetical protein
MPLYSFSLRQPVAAYIYFLHFPSLIYFPQSFLHKRLLEGSSNARCDDSGYPSFISHSIGPADLLHHSPALYFKIFQVFLNYYPMCPNFNTIQIAVPNVDMTGFFNNLLVKIICFLWSAAYVMAILDLIPGVHLANVLSRYPRK